MKLKDIFKLETKTIAPQSDVHYHLYSLPSFDDNQTREEVKGQDIMSNKLVVPNRCILFNKLNVRFKRVWRINNQDENKLASTEFLPLIVNEQLVDFNFAYFLLVSDSLTNYLCGQNSNTSGSHKRIDPNVLLNMDITLPTRSEQERTGKLLTEIDEKIALNREINRNLEAMARQLYDYWFVQFDFPDENGRPYKSSGGKMIWNEKLKHEIPYGWEVAAIGDILDKYPTTKRFDTSEYLNEGLHPIIDQGDSYIVGFTNETVNVLHKYPAVLFGDHSTRVKFIDFPFGRGADGTQILYSKSSKISQWYLYLFVSSLSIPNPGYSRHFKYLKEMLIIVPSQAVTDEFSKVIEPVFTEWTSQIFEVIQLSKQRDELLPLLMNGQVSVMQPEVNCDLEAAKNCIVSFRLVVIKTLSIHVVFNKIY